MSEHDREKSRYDNRKTSVLEGIEGDVGKQQMCVWYYSGEAQARAENIPYWQRPDFLADYIINHYETKSTDNSTEIRQK